MKNKKHLNYYFKCLKKGHLINANSAHFHGGLCGSADNNEINAELFELFKDNDTSRGYWGAPDLFWPRCVFEFTTLRQTIVLLMAAMNDEL